MCIDHMEHPNKYNINAVEGGRCGECGGTVKLIAKPGRTCKIFCDTYIEIPEDFPLLTCTKCGDEYSVPEVNEVLYNLLVARIEEHVAKYYESKNDDVSIDYAIQQANINSVIEWAQSPSGIERKLSVSHTSIELEDDNGKSLQFNSDWKDAAKFVRNSKGK